MRAIISLRQTLDLRVVAEGIECEDQRRELKRLGCDRGQGYLFSRPRPAGELPLEFGRGLPALLVGDRPQHVEPRRPPRREDRRHDADDDREDQQATIWPTGMVKPKPSLLIALITTNEEQPEHEPERRAEHRADHLS